ncbi:TlpA family protein disulfide reductase [Amycolatopsis tucumanensis]|uniref:TlpA disulfide reductase family protein n=1 Tax=Amycolatopsis tucumanensis TaxID=401106 RepID=A0ABP7IV68_9PSEU|nr:TlpA disulfide reductase family protein [Amycolatopsis tucumanensis]MCF6429057.1 TlpA family protein disulfide reductase [Amycolatopsis tucumanensis]
MTTATRWALVAGVLVLAVIVAVLPQVRSDSPAAGPDLTAARAAAALAPCPSGTGEVAQLAGVRAECLGDGTTVDLGSALAGQVTLVNVWATWCEPCRTELPVLQRYASEPGAVRVLTVQVQSKPDDGLELLAELGVRLPTVFDGDGGSGPVRSALKVPPALPASYLVTADGQVRLIESPRTFTDPEQVREVVRRLS